jgi:pimeloyl-ACP methyl ester carboxylesterase
MIRKKSIKIIIIAIVIQTLCFSVNTIAFNFENNTSEKQLINSSTKIQNINQINVTFNSSGYELYAEIYYPLNTSNIYPVVVFCEGLNGYIDAYNWIPKALAEENYVTMVFDPPGQGISEGLFPIKSYSIPFLNLYVRSFATFEAVIHYFSREWVAATSDAITYLLEQSEVKGLIDSSKVGLIGHSLGGITVTETAANDDRVDAVVALSQGNPLFINKIKVPIQFQGGGFDLGTYSVPILSRCYKKVDPPKELIIIKFGTHFGFSTALNQFNPCPPWQKEVCFRYAQGWFDYFLKDDLEAYEIITTGHEHLSKIIQSKYNLGDGDQILE